ncbi:MAG: hypothetical protein COT74_02480 [Bdellovibrionales bacterium CG10_big_fil_rev_8_21_14_0_10_45_34]|nr:MAG: hypothetical protein COT74_02480 [Bdellovibrionales bacterium CG10_big_fil_rev_8_21_14_0_10_45_34]
MLGQKEKVANTEPLSLKETYEANLGEIVYNKSHNTVGSPVEVKKAQCLSGTTLLTFINAARGYEKFASSNQVVVLENGHILPAFMQREENAWSMKGVETTVAGKGIKNYGKTSELDKPPEARRVLRADYFLLIVALGDKVANLSELQNVMLQKTAAQYEIPLEKLEESVKAVQVAYQQKIKERQENAGSAADDGNSTVTGSAEENSWIGELAFGETNVPEGDQPRIKMDEVPVATSGGGVVGPVIEPNELFHEVVTLEKLERRPWELSSLKCGGADVQLEDGFVAGKMVWKIQDSKIIWKDAWGNNNISRDSRAKFESRPYVCTSNYKSEIVGIHQNNEWVEFLQRNRGRNVLYSLKNSNCKDDSGSSASEAVSQVQGKELQQSQSEIILARDGSKLTEISKEGFLCRSLGKSGSEVASYVLLSEYNHADRRGTTPTQSQDELNKQRIE